MLDSLSLPHLRLEFQSHSSTMQSPSTVLPREPPHCAVMTSTHSCIFRTNWLFSSYYDMLALPDYQYLQTQLASCAGDTLGHHSINPLLREFCFWTGKFHLQVNGNEDQFKSILKAGNTYCEFASWFPLKDQANSGREKQLVEVMIARVTVNMYFTAELWYWLFT